MDDPREKMRLLYDAHWMYEGKITCERCGICDTRGYLYENVDRDDMSITSLKICRKCDEIEHPGYRY